MKIVQIYLKGEYGSTHIVSDKTLKKVFEVIDENVYLILVRMIMVKAYCPLIRICKTCWKIEDPLNHL